MRPRITKNRLSLEKFNALRRELKLDIDEQQSKLSRKDFLKYLKQRFSELQDTTDENSPVLLFVVVVRMLLLEEQTGLIGERESEKLRKLAEDLLQVQGIHQNSQSELRFLYSDVRTVYGQVLRSRGDHMGALWETLLAERASIDPNHPHIVLSKVNRLLRAGDASKAFNLLKETNFADSHPTFHARSLLTGLQCHKLISDRATIHAYAAEAMTQLKRMAQVEAPKNIIEVEWLLKTSELRFGENPLSLISATRRTKDHYQPAYILDMILTVLACPSRALLKQLPNVASMRRNGTLAFVTNPLYEAVTVLQNCYDTSIDLEVRIRSLGDAIKEFKRLLILDSELVAWVAAARFLIRSKAYALGEFCVTQYHDLSRKISHGRTIDILGTAGDLNHAATGAPYLSEIDDVESA